jgi:glycosyltransferase involved in cell wall biosynthesis
MEKMKFSIVIPLWNEEKNIEKLISSFNFEILLNLGLVELILVNNGSTDNSKSILNSLPQNPLLKVVHLEENLGYGGGILHGIQLTKTNIICYLPGDLQYTFDDLIKVINIYILNSSNIKLFVKGYRIQRQDSRSGKFVSRFYSFLARLVLGIKIMDFNGLPKMFDKSLLFESKYELESSFVLDAHLLYIATLSNFKIIEVPVNFYKRNSGVSSWSNKKLRTYFQTLIAIIAMRIKYF